jgi:acetyl esterase/lipase
LFTFQRNATITQATDVVCAVKWFRTKKKEFGLDGRVFVAGFSAGGHIALMLGCQGHDGAVFEVEESGDCGDSGGDGSVQCVANFYGVTDLPGWKARTWGASERTMEMVDFATKQLLGTTETTDPVYSATSPVSICSRGSAPVITFHGTADFVVPLKQARDLDKTPKKAGVVYELHIIEGAGHGWRGEEAERSADAVAKFFLENLAG